MNDNADGEPGPSTRARVLFGALLVFTFAVRLIRLDQPIVEGYVGRQIPTAMVARNLDRGSGFLNPILDVAPFPNRFLVEPPVYAATVVGLKRLSGLSLDASGRAVSAFGVTLAAWGLFGLAWRREGVAVALGAVAAFSLFPVTLKYGRVFQPDALMLGCLVAGLRCSDESRFRGKWWLLPAYFFLATGFALKVTSAFVLVPLAFVLTDRGGRERLVLTAATLLPAFLWYFYAAGTLMTGAGSQAAADNGSIWFSVFLPTAWLKAETYANVGRFLLLRAFTPLGPPLAIAGLLIGRPRGDRFWVAWGLSALCAMALMAAKLHHEYYWLALAPVMALGLARCVGWLAGQGSLGRFTSIALSLLFASLCVYFSRSTWQTPAEWVSIKLAAREVRRLTPPDSLVVAPEVLLYQADRRGCRLEFTESAARRAAGEWRSLNKVVSPGDLVRFYREQGATHFADVIPREPSPGRLALHAEVRRRYKVEVDGLGVLIARLRDTEPEGGPQWPSRNLPITGRKTPSP